MVEIFVNLKRFDVPRERGGVCPQSNPKAWIEHIIQKTIDSGLGKSNEIHLTYLLPESLLIPAIEIKNGYPRDSIANLDIGCQGVYRENITPGGNFGAFTTNLPAAAAAHMGCNWAIIGHSEERKDLFEIMAECDPQILEDAQGMKKANEAINRLLNKSVLNALKSGINVLYCVGETAEERGEGSFEEQKPRIQEVIRSQLETGLRETGSYITSRKTVIGYEPRWAIGPGKTPPDAEYIGFISEYTKAQVKSLFGKELRVVYGGGLKEENAKMIAGIPTIDGGLVALTKFTDEIGFYVEGLRTICEKYLEAV